MNHKDNKIAQLYHVVFSVSRILLRYGKSLFLWFRLAWSRAWQDTFNMLGQMAYLLLNRQTWAISTIVLVVVILLVGPSFIDRTIRIDEWQIVPCNLGGVDIFVHSPKSIAPDDRRFLEITVQNETDSVIRDARVSVNAPDGLMLFEKTNVVTVGVLEKHEAFTQDLNFRVANVQGFRQILASINYYSDNKPVQGEPCPEKVPLLNTTWRRVLVQLKAAPTILDTGAKYLGYLGTIVAGLLTITGKIRPAFKSLFAILKSSHLQANK